MSPLNFTNLDLQNTEDITTLDDLFRMLDACFRDEVQYWDSFYADRGNGAPFLRDAPDENLAEHVQAGRITPGRVLELGCGPGRNALWLAEQGFQVDAVDISPEAIAWARERAEARGLTVNFICQSIFDLDIDAGAYTLVYDANCFHHVTPHRRFSYFELVERALAPGGYYGLTCFNTTTGAGLSDWEVYRRGKTMGGMQFNEERLRALFAPHFDILELRRMRDLPEDSATFGKEIFWTALMRKRD